MDAGLSFLSGHHAGFLLRVISHFQIDIASSMVFCSNSAICINSPVCKIISKSLRPVLGATGYEGFTDTLYCSELDNKLQFTAAQTLALNFLQYDAILAGSRQVVVLNATLATVQAIDGWLSLRGVRFKPALTIHLLSGVGVSLKPVGSTWRLVETDPILRNKLRASLERISLQAPNASLLLSSKMRIAELRALSNLPSKVFKFQNDIVPVVMSGLEKNASKSRVILYMGDAKHDKGISALPSVLASLVEKSSDWSFFAQVNDVSGRFSGVSRQLLEESIGHPQISLHFGWLDEEFYLKILSTASAVVLLHTIDGYHDKESGIVADADLFKIPIICRVGTAIERLTKLSGHSAEAKYFSADSEIGDLLDDLLIEKPMVLKF